MRGAYPMPAMFRALSKFTVDEGCWLWTAARDPNGYGRIQNKREGSGLAHRVVWESLRGPIPNGLVPDHLCRVTSCVRPSHMELVTQEVNASRVSSTNALKTECPLGHPYTGENLIAGPDKRRRCRTCTTKHQRDWYLRQVEIRHGTEGVTK